MASAPQWTATPVADRRRLRRDRYARWLVTAGGAGIVASILGILLFIIWEVWPLVSPVRLESVSEVRLPAEHVEALLVDEYRTYVAALGLDGKVRVIRPNTGAVVSELPVVAQADGLGTSSEASGTARADMGPREHQETASPALLRTQAFPECRLLAGSTSQGQVILVRMTWNESFEGATRVITPVIETPIVLDVDPQRRPILVFSATSRADGGAIVVAQLADQSLAVVRRVVAENAFTGDRDVRIERDSAPVAYQLTELILDRDGRNLYGGTPRGELLWWRVEEGSLASPEISTIGSTRITALCLLLGDRSLVVGGNDGSLGVWAQVRQPDQSFRLQRIRGFAPHPGPVRLLAPSMRGKGFLAQDERGVLGMYFSTSERTLWKEPSPLQGASALALAPKGNGAFLAGDGRLIGLDVNNPHPEVTLHSLFAPVWYEDSQQPEYSWQSTGGTDDFEPKLSLTPLLVGTLKGTFYSLLLAIPIGVLSAMYASQFMHPKLRRYVKPTVEIMAALPSVVLGFLAGLWLAPRVERFFPSLMLMIIVIPLAILAAGWLWSRLPGATQNRFLPGMEVVPFVVVVGLSAWLCIALNDTFERFAFAGDFQAWLLGVTGLKYDQRNAIVVGLAMGFAVIPIIFAISEDAFSNVPPNLISGSLALGANRWQTVTRVVLPTASPGIFSAVMVGFGRAVGETMIVLMATGNTPILSWNPFNGFRTLSANIAVEIPEAPHNTTLYRTLFLAGLLLFLLTFAVNTVAELVRQRLRVRYGQL
jgi:phosphate transport system permease protein